MLSWLRSLIPQPEIRAHLLRDEGEVIVDEVAHHWVAYTRAVLWMLLGLLLLVIGAFAEGAWLFLFVGVGILVYAAYKAMTVHMDRFVVTNMRVFRIHGVLSQSLATMPLVR